MSLEDVVTHRAVIHRMSPPAHDVQDVVCSVHVTVDAVQDGVIYIKHICRFNFRYGSELQYFSTL